MNDPDRIVAWLAGLDDELPAHPWAPAGLTADEDLGGGDGTGGLVNLAFIREVLRRATWLWCITALLGLVIGTGLYVRYPPAYHAQTSVVLVDEANQDAAVEVLTDVSLAQSEPVAARVVQELGLRQSVASLQAAYSVTPITYTVLQFQVGGPSGAAAIQRASALATSFLQYRAKYAQTQEQQQVAQLNQETSAAEQSFQAIDTQINQLPATQLTPAQKLQLDTLQTQLGDQKQTMQYATGTVAATKASTAAMVSGSYILDPPVLLAHSAVKGAALYVAGGLFLGLVVGMAIVIVAALLSSRLRRRDDVAAALGAPVRLSVGSVRAPGRLPALPWRAAKRDRDIKRVIAYLQGRVSGSSRGPSSLAIVAVDDVQTVASAVAALARSRARAGGQVVVADLSSGVPLARLLGAKDPGVHDVSHDDGGRLVVAVPERHDVTPVGPMRDGSSPALWAQPDEAVVTAYSSADLLLTLATLDPALGADHLATWASEAIAVVTAGRSSAQKVHSAGEMIRLAGIRLDSAVLLGADRNDETLGVMDPAHPIMGLDIRAAAVPMNPASRSGGDGVPDGGLGLLFQCCFHLRQWRSFSVSLRYEGDGKRPRYGQFRVIECDGNVLAWIVRAVDPIGDVGGIGESLEPVRATGGHVERDLLVVAQSEALPVTVGRRRGPQVHDHVEHRAVGAADQLRLAIAASKVQAADNAADRARQAVLREAPGVDSGLARDVGIEGPGKKATLVHVRLRSEQQRALNSRNAYDLHDAPSCRYRYARHHIAGCPGSPGT